MKKAKKALVFFLICSALVTSAAACSDKTAQGPDPASTESVPESSAAAETELTPDLPRTDMGGRTFTLLTQSWDTYTPLDFVDIAPEGMTGEPLNDAAFERNSTMASDCNCAVEQFNVQSAGEAVSQLQKTVNSGDSAFDVCFMRGTNFASVLSGGYLLELSSLPHIDFEKPWWDFESKAALSIKGKSYVVCGDLSTNDMLAVWNICFNKEMIADYNLGDPYAAVKDGTWTFDKAVEMSKAVANDINGDAVMDGNDLWGINYTNDTVIGVLNACGVNIAELDKDGIPQITVSDEKSVGRTVDVFTKLFDESYAMDTLSRKIMYVGGDDGFYFANKQVLFLYTATHLVSQLRQMDVDFGILPYPKYEQGDEYAPSTAGIFLSMAAVPSSNTDPENTGIFMEAYAYLGYKSLVPAFYDKILQGKLIRDDTSGEILDFLYNNISYDTGNLYNFAGFTGLLCSLSATRNTDIASFLAKNTPALQKAIDQLTESLN